MATVLNPISPTANPSLICTRNAHAFMYMYSNSNSIPNLYFVSLNKRVSKKLASTTTQMSLTPKETFLIPDWKGNERDYTTTKERLRRRVYHAYTNFKYKVRLGHRPDPLEGEKLLYALVEWGMWSNAIRVVEMMLTSGVNSKMSCYTNLVSFLCEKGRVDRAMQFMEKMEEDGYPTNNNVYTILVQGLSKQGSLSLDVLERFIRKGWVLDAYTYSILLEVVCREKGVDEATRVLDEIASNGERLDLVHYNVLLTGLCNEGRTDDAIRLLRDLPSKGFHPNVVSFNILLGNLCFEKRWEEAMALLAEISEMGQGPTLATYNILIGSLAQQGKVEAAFEVLEDTKRANLKPVTGTYNLLLDPICKDGKVDLAVECVDQMISNHCYATEGTYNALAQLYQHGKALDGFILIQTLWNIHPLPDSECIDMILSLCKNGNTQPALELLSLMTKDGFVPNSYTLIREPCAEGKGEEAMEVGLARLAMEEFGHKPKNINELNFLIVQLCRLQRTDLAIEVLERMIEKGYKPNEKTYIGLVKGIGHDEGELELAEEVLKELYQKQVMRTRTVKKICMEFNFKLYV